MLFGHTTEEREAREDLRKVWHRAFAWRPVKLVDGRWVWLETVERCSYLADHIHWRTPFSLGGWCFRLPSKGRPE